MKLKNPFKHLRPWRSPKRKQQEKPVPQKKKEERGFDAKSLVLVVSLWVEFADTLGNVVKRPKEWQLGEVTKRVVFSEGHEKNTLIEVELLEIPLRGAVPLNTETEEWQSNDSGVLPVFNDKTVFRDHQLLMRLNSQTPQSKFIWEKGATVTVTGDCVYHATYIRLLKLIMSR